jgi:hypothetical protein
MMGPKKWARVKLSGAHNLRRGAWYPVVNDSSAKIVVLDVAKRNVPVPRESVELADAKPEAWSVVKFNPDKPLPARISQENLPLTYAVCPFCRARSVEVDGGTPMLKCDECGKEAPVDWDNPC